MSSRFVKKTFQFIILLVLLSGCKTIPVDNSGVIGKIYLKDLCQENDIQWQWDSVSQVVTLDVDGIQVKGLVGSEVVLLADHKVFLSDSLKTYKSSITVPADFKRKVIDPLREKPRSYKSADLPLKKYPAIKKVKHIIIDAGHGGKDSGAIGYSGVQEKDVVLDISKRLNKILRQKGFKVIMTRGRDDFISLKGRTEITSKSKADIFVSVHANSSPARSAKGIEVYSLKDLQRDERDEEQRRENEKILFKKLSMEQGNQNLNNIASDMLYTHKQSKSLALAEIIVNESSRFVKARNRGAKDSRFFVLRNTLVPSVLVEVGFLSNPQEEKLLNTIGYRQKLAYAIARGIISYANGEY